MGRTGGHFRCAGCGLDIQLNRIQYSELCCPLYGHNSFILEDGAYVYRVTDVLCPTNTIECGLIPLKGLHVFVRYTASATTAYSIRLVYFPLVHMILALERKIPFTLAWETHATIELLLFCSRLCLGHWTVHQVPLAPSSEIRLG